MLDPAAFDALPWPQFLAQQQLPEGYRQQAARWFMPLLESIDARRRLAGHPLLVAINGSQGSGKSTLAALLAMALPRLFGLSVCALSLDDFYLTRTARQSLATRVHPLLATRGVPGTHDVALMQRTLEALRRDAGQLAVPAFDKAQDDRVAEGEWQRVATPVDVAIWEGWCLGVPPQSEEALAKPVNQLEREEDHDGQWRRYVNRALARDYEPLFAQVDLWVMLAAPSFGCVQRWRSEQEEKLAVRRGADAIGLMSSAQIARFVEFYQRLTEWGLERLPPAMDYCYRLDEQRQIRALQGPMSPEAL